MRVRHKLYPIAGKAVREVKFVPEDAPRVEVVWESSKVVRPTNIPFLRNLVFRVPCVSRPMR